MKAIKIITGLSFLILFINCRENPNADSVNKTPYSNTPSNGSVKEANNMNDAANETRERINAADSMNNVAENNRNDVNKGGNGNAADTNRMNKMFADLNFTPEQIEKFNTNYRSSLEEWKKNNPSSKISSDEHLRMEDRQMKSFLSAAQYQQYQEWVKENPTRNQL